MFMLILIERCSQSLRAESKFTVRATRVYNNPGTLKESKGAIYGLAMQCVPCSSHLQRIL